MIQKLRRKFILTSMALVTLVLLMVFACIVTITWRNQQAQVNRTLNTALERGIVVSVPALEWPFGENSTKARLLEEFLSFPVFVVTIDQYGYVTQAVGQNVSISLDLAKQAMLAALNTGDREGYIPQYHMQFRCAQLSGGIRYAFVETSRVEAAMAAILFTCLAALACALVLLFFIARYLAAQAVRPVAEAWERQRQFVADASHELKTPLTVILANTGILLSHPNSTVGEQAKWLENTQTEAQRMKTLVEELLFLARSEGGKTPVVLGPVSLTDILWSCLLPFETIAFEAGVELKSDVAEGVVLTGDAGQLKQLLMILLDNACKYTPAGGVITVTLARAGDKARLCVHNTGDPIPPEDLPHLFERFYRSDKSRAQETGGYGLGLAIAQTLAQAHKGKISVESTPERGTTFTVTLPLLKEKEKAALPPA